MSKRTKPSIVVLFSGGLDSTYMCYKYWKKGYDVIPLYMDNKDSTETGYDFETAIRSEGMLHRIGAGVRGLYVAPYYSAAAPVYPARLVGSNVAVGRNLMFLATAATFAAELGAKEIGIGVYEETGKHSFPDASKKFITAARNVFAAADMPYKINTLAEDYSKATVLAKLNDQCLMGDFMYDTRWCYNRSELAQSWGTGCGECLSCKLMMYASYEVSKYVNKQSKARQQARLSQGSKR